MQGQRYHENGAIGGRAKMIKLDTRNEKNIEKYKTKFNP